MHPLRKCDNLKQAYGATINLIYQVICYVVFFHSMYYVRSITRKTHEAFFLSIFTLIITIHVRKSVKLFQSKILKLGYMLYIYV